MRVAGARAGAEGGRSGRLGVDAALERAGSFDEKAKLGVASVEEAGGPEPIVATGSIVSVAFQSSAPLLPLIAAK